MVVEYDGTGFYGFVPQPGLPTIQPEIEAALSEITGEAIRIRFASRTDAGVHARGQIVAFDTTRETIPDVGFTRGVTTKTDPRIVIRHTEAVEPGWDPRRRARGKHYRYIYFNAPQPSALDRDRSWWVRDELDLEAMNAAAQHLIGHHDFEAFRSSGCPSAHARRRMYTVDVAPGPREHVVLTVMGNAFCKHMVRIFAGTLATVGRGRWTPDEVAEIVASRERARAGLTAPAKGLTLEEVIYDERLPPRPEFEEGA